MTDRIISLKKHIEELGDAGVRKTTFFALLADSLKVTLGEPVPIRRAKAFAYLLDKADQVVQPFELVAGSIMGIWPLDNEPSTFEQKKMEADQLIAHYIKRKSGQEEEKTNRISIGYKKKTTFQSQRFAVMARDHYDASITFPDMQKIIKEMVEKYRSEKTIESFEIGREIERYFEYDYGEETMKLLDELPWEALNHADLNYGKCVRLGFGQMLQDIETYIEKALPEHLEFYQSTKIAIEAVIRFINRYADTLREAQKIADPIRASELAEMAKICRTISTNRPGTFKEALQLVWMVHVIGNLAGGCAMSFARFDQYMRPFYEKDISENIINDEQVIELLSCVWLKVNEPKMRTVQSLCLGGVKPDGTDGASDLTRCCIESIRQLKLPYPNVSVRYDTDVSPVWLLDEAVQTIQCGFGNPMLLNDQLWVPNLMKLGYTPEMAREYYNMGCVEILIQGRQPYWVGSGGVNYPKLVLDVLDEVVENNIDIPDFNAFLQMYLQHIHRIIRLSGEQGLERLANLQKPFYDPFASVLIENCLEKGVDVLQGGAEFPAHLAIGATGLGTGADSLSAIKTYVFDQKLLSLKKLVEILKNNFEGEESLRVKLAQGTPNYGNDLNEADDIAKTIFDAYSNDVFALNENTKARFVNVLFSYNGHMTTGEVTGATPNGRLKGETLSDCVGPSQGKDVHGPTKLLNSVLKLDFSKVTGAFALNVKINPSWAQKPSGKLILTSIIHAYFKDHGPQLQFNMQKVEDLKKAQEHPEENRDIVVRIAGYCEYFVNLDRHLQDEIISRTAHELIG